ncbi:hypothetical protein EDB19DRAFT_1763574 [Suillus lakei]|nr:hypothetical protein EDB19DRAFT_1763574 [Suillus lakei]
MNSLGGIIKLRTFCEIARDAGYRWAWNDTYYIDTSNDVELQESLNFMFVGTAIQRSQSSTCWVRVKKEEMILMVWGS